MTFDLYCDNGIASNDELDRAKKDGVLIILGPDEYVREVYKRIDQRRGPSGNSGNYGLSGLFGELAQRRDPKRNYIPSVDERQQIDDLIDKLTVTGKFGSKKMVCRPLPGNTARHGKWQYI